MKTMHCNFAPLFSSYPSIFAKIHFRLFQVLQLSCKVAKKDEKSEIGVKGLSSFYGVRKKENCIYHNISQKTQLTIFIAQKIHVFLCILGYYHMWLLNIVLKILPNFLVTFCLKLIQQTIEQDILEFLHLTFDVLPQE